MRFLALSNNLKLLRATRFRAWGKNFENDIFLNFELWYLYVYPIINPNDIKYREEKVYSIKIMYLIFEVRCGLHTSFMTPKTLTIKLFKNKTILIKCIKQWRRFNKRFTCGGVNIFYVFPKRYVLRDENSILKNSLAISKKTAIPMDKSIVVLPTNKTLIKTIYAANFTLAGDNWNKICTLK